jgi:cyclin D1/2/4
MSTRAPPAVAPSDPAASAAAEATRASLQRRVERATCDSRAHSVLVRRALDELRGALAAERRQAAFLPADLGARLADVAQMRACLVEGLVRSALAFELSVCTTALAVRYLDRFLGAGAYDVSKHQGWVYHLVANACQSIAVKLQESLRVDPDTLQRHFDVRFDKACVLKMESLVLRELGWSVNDVVAATHAPRLLYALGFAGDAHAELVTKTDLFLLSTLYDPNMCHVWAPSVLAAAGGRARAQRPTRVRRRGGRKARRRSLRVRRERAPFRFRRKGRRRRRQVFASDVVDGLERERGRTRYRLCHGVCSSAGGVQGRARRRRRTEAVSFCAFSFSLVFVFVFDVSFDERRTIFCDE